METFLNGESNQNTVTDLAIFCLLSMSRCGMPNCVRQKVNIFCTDRRINLLVKPNFTHHSLIISLSEDMKKIAAGYTQHRGSQWEAAE